jgi:hypothetical protein
MVVSLRSHNSIPCYNEDRRKAEGWLNLTQAAFRVGVSSVTLRLAIERGEIEGEHPLPDGPWILNCRALETPGAAELADRSRTNNTRGTKRTPALAADEQGLLNLSVT